jgi:hypothetical protein
MSRDDVDRTRRDLLRVLAGTGTLAGLAGCNALGGEADTPASSESPTRAGVPTREPRTAATTSTDTATTPAHRSPVIESHAAMPERQGRRLRFTLTAEGAVDLASVTVTYGDHEWSTEVSERRIRVEDSFTDLDESQPTTGTVRFRVRDATGQETRVETTPDQQAPALATYSVEPTETADTVSLALTASDDVGLETFHVEHDSEPLLDRGVAGQREVTVDRTVEVSRSTPGGGRATFAARLEDWTGNATTSQVDSYVRHHDVLEDPRLEVGAVYILWAGDKFGSCFEPSASPQPAVGQYGDPISPAVTSRHIDQMQGVGITNVLVNFNGMPSDRDRVRQFVQSQLVSETKLRPFYTIKDYRWEPDDDTRSWKEDLLPRDMGFLREQFLRRDNAFEYDGRPVVSIWNAARLPWADEYHHRIVDDWGDYASFVEDVRSHLRVEGTDPFIIGGVVGAAGYHGFPNDRIVDFLSELDGTSTWVASGAWGSDDRATWAEMKPWVERDFEGHRTFCENHDMEFVPMVFPGFDDRPNTCWGQDRYTPRSTDGFEALLELADEYRTADMIDVATWNDWTEGSQIEPGSFRETDYGTAYLELVEEFQQS